MKWSGKGILVTGGAGLIGSRIVQRLVREGAIVKILDNLSAYPFDQLDHFGLKKLRQLEVITGDIRNENTFKRDTFEDIDVVFHEAAFADVAATIWNPEEDFSSNVMGTFNLLKWALDSGVDRFIFASSAAVYGEQNENGTKRILQFPEDMKPNPISTYANSKLWGEYETLLFHELYGLRATVLRYFSVYGGPQVPKEGSHSWVVAIFAMRLLKGKPLIIFGNGEQIRDFVHVNDVALASILSCEKNSTIGKIINVGTGRPTSIRNLAEMIRELGEVKVPVKYAPRLVGDPFGGFADTRFMEKMLNWKPGIKLEEGIKKYYKWVSTNRVVIPTWL